LKREGMWKKPSLRSRGVQAVTMHEQAASRGNPKRDWGEKNQLFRKKGTPGLGVGTITREFKLQCRRGWAEFSYMQERENVLAGKRIRQITKLSCEDCTYEIKKPKVQES